MDREDLARPSLKLTEEEEMADKVRVKSYGDVDMVLGRRKNGECSTPYIFLISTFFSVKSVRLPIHISLSHSLILSFNLSTLCNQSYSILCR